MKKRKLTKAEREEWDAQRAQMRANAQRTRELAERAQAKLDEAAAERAVRPRWRLIFQR
jgi:hypothetical protein